MQTNSKKLDKLETKTRKLQKSYYCCSRPLSVTAGRSSPHVECDDRRLMDTCRAQKQVSEV